MKEAARLNEKIGEVQELLHAKFGVKKRGLAKMLKRTGRRLPRRLRTRAQVLVRAEPLVAHPKLARQVNWGEVDAAHGALVRHLEAIDPAEARKDRLLKMAALIAFYVLVVLTTFVWWLWWAGYV